MTQMGLNYLAHLEVVRHNLATEGETQTHNRNVESETFRHNLVGELQNQQSIDELARHNLAVEVETNRSNLAREFETHRSNVAREVETERHNKATEANAAVQLSELVRHNKETEKYNLSYLAEQSRHNKSVEAYNASSLVELQRHQKAVEEETRRANDLKALSGTSAKVSIPGFGEIRADAASGYGALDAVTDVLNIPKSVVTSAAWTVATRTTGLPTLISLAQSSTAKGSSTHTSTKGVTHGGSGGKF